MVQRSLGRIKLCDMMESLGSYLRQIRKGSPLKSGDVNAWAQSSLKRANLPVKPERHSLPEKREFKHGPWGEGLITGKRASEGGSGDQRGEDRFRAMKGGLTARGDCLDVGGKEGLGWDAFPRLLGECGYLSSPRERQQKALVLLKCSGSHSELNLSAWTNDMSTF